jgi:hypothetical protein
MSETALQRTVRRAAAVVVLALCALTLTLHKWIGYQSGVDFGGLAAVTWLLAVGSLGYLAVSALLQGLAASR